MAPDAAKNKNAHPDGMGIVRQIQSLRPSQRTDHRERTGPLAAEIVPPLESASSQAWIVDRQAEKLLPQPQLFTAFGLSNVKPRFSSPS